MSKIWMPTVEDVVCQECNELQQILWGKFGAELPCINCDAAPVFLAKVGA
jgi:hypothetical protein